jgi:tropomodulin
LPACDRSKPQTNKEATGPYDRNKLLDFLTEQGKNEKDWEHYKPYVPGEKKGKVWEPPAVVKPPSDDDDEFLVATEWDDVLTNANETEIVELAGISSHRCITNTIDFDCLAIVLAILGFTGLINQVQYHAAVADKSIPTNAGGWNGRLYCRSSMIVSYSYECIV